MTTPDGSEDTRSLRPEADSIHRAIRAIVDARATGSAATWEGMEVLDAAYGEDAFRHPSSIFRDNDAVHGRAARPVPEFRYRLLAPGNRIEWYRRLTFDAHALTNNEVAAVADSRVDPADSTVSSGNGASPDPHVEEAVRAIRRQVARTVDIAGVPASQFEEVPGFSGPPGAERDGNRALAAVVSVVRLLKTGNEDGARQTILRCTAESQNGWLSANCALVTAGFLLGVTSVHWAALGLASSKRVIACDCRTTCDRRGPFE